MSVSLLAPSITQLGWNAMCWDMSPMLSSGGLGVLGGAGLTTLVLWVGCVSSDQTECSVLRLIAVELEL